MLSPVTIYIVHHADCEEAYSLATELFKWFRQGYSSAAIPVYFRRYLDKAGTLLPEIKFDEAELNIVVMLVDQKMVLDQEWRNAAIELAVEIQELRPKITKPIKKQTKNSRASSAILLPVALHDSFYRTGPLYEHFNPIRLFHLSDNDKRSTLRRAVTEAIARSMRSTDQTEAPPLNVFLSHAKFDGNEIAIQLRDEVRNFSQMEAWYDANDLPYGADWNSPMTDAAKQDTAAMISIVTDMYPLRPWCRQEVTLARTPRPLAREPRIWRLQPVVAVHRPGNTWSNSLPMLGGVARIGWQDHAVAELTQQILDRLVLELLFSLVHQRIARALKRKHKDSSNLYITWTPDMWTLAALQIELGETACDVEKIYFPGYGLSPVEQAEQHMIAKLFDTDTKLCSFGEALQSL